MSDEDEPEELLAWFCPRCATMMLVREALTRHCCQTPRLDDCPLPAETPLVDELFRRRGAPVLHFHCATCPLSCGCSWECLRADDFCEIAELKAELERLKVP